MGAEILTTDDLREFKMELLDELKDIIKTIAQEPKKRYLKSPQVKDLMGISAGTLANLRVNGTLPYSKVGGIILYEYDEIINLINENRVHNKQFI